MDKKRKTSERSWGKVDLVRQAIYSAETSLQLAKRLLSEISGPSISGVRELEGVIGIFDGKFMITEDKKKYQVPENYASKTRLVIGDKLKMIKQGGEFRFKQIVKVKRKFLDGILAKKDGKPVVVTVEGSFDLIPAAVRHFEVQEGDQLKVSIPQDDKHVSFAALEENTSKKLRQKEEKSSEPAPETPKKEEPKESPPPIRISKSPPKKRQGSPKADKKIEPKPARGGRGKLKRDKEEEKEKEVEKTDTILEEEDLR